MASDRITFVGPTIPVEIKILGKSLAALPPKKGVSIVKTIIDGKLCPRFSL